MLRSLSGHPFFILCISFLSERSQVGTSAPFTQLSTLLNSLYFISEWTEPRWVPVLRSLSGRPFFILCVLFLSERSQVGTSAPFTQRSSLLNSLYFISEWTEPRWVPVLRSLSGHPFFILCILFLSDRSQVGTSAPFTQRSSLLYSLYIISEWTEPRWVPVLRSLSGRPFFILCILFLCERSQVGTSAPFTQRSSLLYSLYFISEWTEPRWVPVLRSLSGRPFFILCILFLSERSLGGYQCSVHSAVVSSLLFVFYFWANGA